MSVYKINPKRPLDPVVTSILKEVTRIAQNNSIECILVGATARDILLTHVVGMEIQRATVDVDFAIAVKNWQEFDLIKGQLAQLPNFYLSQTMNHRLYVGQGEIRSKGDYPVDLLPFGGVEDKNNLIYWPPDMAVMMNVAGYAEVTAAAVEVEIMPNVLVRTASLPGLTVLKLFAWQDRGNENAKDAQDVFTMMSEYAGAGNQTRLHGEKFNLLESAGYDVTMAGIRLLGQDVSSLLSNQTFE